MKWEQILPEVLALIGGGIVFLSCLIMKKSGEYTFFSTFVVSLIGYICGHFIKGFIEKDS
ncbi:hypothetical protein [Caldicellulosiruptor naganoensis]|uniref:Uncharacterized protein n=1 Tax=Caldicellulosiruptor naganoensis TaxID=29324 RepID=A0ABY7BH19_9FIRM|nr:hypothetical protein [Caldicellulosiruptor naganoensis]WAM32125.1 hypothetical protein OTJ99_000632 [Caldicellulosiruptor naganoensis]